MHCAMCSKTQGFRICVVSYHCPATAAGACLSSFLNTGGVKWTGSGVIFGNLLKFEAAFAFDRFDDGTLWLVLTAV